MTEGFWWQEGQDGFGNRIITSGMTEPHREIWYRSHGDVEMSTYCIPEAMPHPMYGRLTRVRGDFLGNCLGIMHEVNGFLTYCPGVTDVNTQLEDVLRLRRGVCQDYAHLMVQRCREAGYPARYVCGMMAGEGATHAWVEVYDGQCWYAFDPTNDTAIASGYVKLAHGRSAADCPVIRGTYRNGVLPATSTDQKPLQGEDISVSVKVLL